MFLTGKSHGKLNSGVKRSICASLVYEEGMEDLCPGVACPRYQATSRADVKGGGGGRPSFLTSWGCISIVPSLTQGWLQGKQPLPLCSVAQVHGRSSKDAAGGKLKSVWSIFKECFHGDV